MFLSWNQFILHCSFWFTYNDDDRCFAESNHLSIVRIFMDIKNKNKIDWKQETIIYYDYFFFDDAWKNRIKIEFNYRKNNFFNWWDCRANFTTRLSGIISRVIKLTEQSTRLSHNYHRALPTRTEFKIALKLFLIFQLCVCCLFVDLSFFLYKRFCLFIYKI